MSIDKMLRDAGFEIIDRPKHGPAIWGRRNPKNRAEWDCKLCEETAIRIAMDERREKLKKMEKRK